MITSTTITECFFGDSIKNEKINGKHIPEFMNDLFHDIGAVRFDFLLQVFSDKLIHLGIKKKYRVINQKISLMREWCSHFLKKRIQYIDENM